MWWRSLLGIVLAGSVLFPSVAGGPTAAATVPTAVAASTSTVEGLIVDAATTYRLEPDAGTIHVTVVAQLTNTSPPRREGDYIRTPYFDVWGLVAIGPVDDVRARRDGTDLPTSTVTEDDDLAILVVDLVPNLVHGSPQTIIVEYDLPAQPVRSDAPTRVNPAFASWFVVPTGDPGRADVRIDVPERFAVDFTQLSTPIPETADGRSVYRFDDLGEDVAYFGASAIDEDRLGRRSVTVDDNEFVVHAWPGDDEWADFAVDAVERGIPELVDVTGIELDGRRETTIVETAAPYLLGYAGWYTADSDRIELGDQLDLDDMLHELSHIWFNGELFDSRWINEGLAEVVSNQVVGELGGEPTEPEPVDTSDPGARPLNDWTTPAVDEEVGATEDYGYRASFAVMQALVDDIGADGLRSVLGLAHDQRIPYQGDPDPERMTSPRGWRYFYDLVDVMVGSDELRDLFDEHVLTPDERSEVRARADALERVDELASEGGDWTVPYEVRSDMASWEFGVAEERMLVAEDVLDRRSAIEATLSPIGVALPGLLEQGYETATDLDDVLAFHDAVLAAADDLVTTEDDYDAVGLIGRVGLLGSDVGSHRGAARTAFLVGDLDSMRAELAAVDSAVDDAVDDGLVRLVGLLVVVLLVGGGIVVLRRRRGRADGPLFGPPDPEPAAPADG